MKLPTKLAAAACVAGGVCVLRSEYEIRQLSVECYILYSSKIRGKEKTFVFLTDLHGKEFGRGNARLIEAVRAITPDAVLVGGDMLTAKAGVDISGTCRLIRALAGDFPVYCANGNHELQIRQEKGKFGALYHEYRNMLREAGVCYLANASARFGDDVMVYGIDLWEGQRLQGMESLGTGFMKTRLGEPDEGRFNILLAHSPEFFTEYAAWGADLTLAGHFHGGMIRLPYLGGVITPRFQLFHPWSDGLFVKRDGTGQTRRMIVGRGLGNHTIDVRLNNLPQILVVKVRCN